MAADIIQLMQDGMKIEVNGDQEAMSVCIETLEKMGFQLGFDFEYMVEHDMLQLFNYVYVNAIGLIHMDGFFTGIHEVMTFHRFLELAGDYQPAKLQPASFTDLYDWF